MALHGPVMLKAISRKRLFLTQLEIMWIRCALEIIVQPRIGRSLVKLDTAPGSGQKLNVSNIPRIGSYQPLMSTTLPAACSRRFHQAEIGLKILFLAATFVAATNLSFRQAAFLGYMSLLFGEFRSPPRDFFDTIVDLRP
jgi:hypothetical protein